MVEVSDGNNLKMTNLQGNGVRPSRSDHNIEKSQEKELEMRSSQQTNHRSVLNKQLAPSTTSSEASVLEKHDGRNVHSQFVMGSEYDLADEKEDGYKQKGEKQSMAIHKQSKRKCHGRNG
ncbi:hypothetical protein JTB14_002189 [Gonioctena quinquepunctata]|nr:hypothetical protein JTB14_002189 [Gonioctena quinquepunctata]